MGLTVNQGTQTDVYSKNNGGTEIPVVKIDVGVGTAIDDFGGTIRDVANLAKGTITRIENGTINGTVLSGTLTALASGTITAGTFQLNPSPTVTPLIQGTLGTSGGSLFGTLSAPAGAGIKHYISGLSVIGQSGTADVRILTGTAIQGTGILGAGIVTPGGGYVRDFLMPFVTGTNSELTYHFVGAGTAFIVVNYWKGA